MKIALQRKTDLAVRALRSIGAVGTKVSGAELSDSIGTTTHFLPQIVGPLIDRGWVASTRGPGGGYSLTDAAREVLGNGPCPGADACAAHDAWATARDVLIEGFKGIPAIPTQGDRT
jgi:hypothetical protein